MRKIGLFLLLVLFCASVDAGELALPSKDLMNGQFYAVIPGDATTDPEDWPRRTLERGVVRLERGEELEYRPYYTWTLAKDAVVDETLDKVRHLRTPWGSGDNSRFVKHLDRLRALTTLDLSLPTCCGEVAVEDLEVLKNFPSMQRLGLRMARFSLRWVDYLPNPDKLISLTIVPQLRGTGAVT